MDNVLTGTTNLAVTLADSPFFERMDRRLVQRSVKAETAVSRTEVQPKLQPGALQFYRKSTQCGSYFGLCSVSCFCFMFWFVSASSRAGAGKEGRGKGKEMGE